MSVVAYLGLAVAAVVIVALGLYYWWVYRRNRSLGTPGIVSRVRLTCPKCHQTFDFDFIPGASISALRLGTSRYMACPLCHRWSTFDMNSTRVPAGPTDHP
jgi:hypothetical protein